MTSSLKGNLLTFHKLVKSIVFILLLVYLIDMVINSNYLNAFITLVSEGSFTNAAKALGISQPALSQRIQSLEADLEATLIIREKSGLILTDAGQRVLKYGHTIGNLEDELLNNLESDENELKGQIRIAGFSSVMRSIILPKIAKSLRQYPNLSLQMYTDELESLGKYLFTSKVDFLIFNKPIDRDGFTSIQIGLEENVLVKHKSLKLTDTYLDHDENDITTRSYFRLAKLKQPQKFCYLDDVYGLVDGIKNCLGKAVIPKHLIDSKNMVVESPSIVLKVPIYLCYRTSPYYTKLQKEVISKLSK